MQQAGAAILAAGHEHIIEQPEAINTTQGLLNRHRPCFRPTNVARGVLSLPVLGAVGWLALQNKLGKPRERRTMWSYRSLTGRAADEHTKGFWELTAWGQYDEHLFRVSGDVFLCFRFCDSLFLRRTCCCCCCGGCGIAPPIHATLRHVFSEIASFYK